MCVKLPSRDLNPGPWPLHPTSTYTCGMTIAPKVCGGDNSTFISDVRTAQHNVRIIKCDVLVTINSGLTIVPSKRKGTLEFP